MTATESPTHTSALVDPRAPRFGQAITTALLLGGVALATPELVYLTAAILGVTVLSRWRVDLYRLLWHHLVIPIVGPPAQREAAAPHRFAKLLGAVGSAIATVFLLAGVPLIGFAIAAIVGLLAGLAATTGFCLGCRMYRQVSFLRSRGIV